MLTNSYCQKTSGKLDFAAEFSAGDQYLAGGQHGEGRAANCQISRERCRELVLEGFHVPFVTPSDSVSASFEAEELER